MGRFGQKTGAGWYRYENGKPVPDALTQEIKETAARENGLTRRSFAADEIRLRLVASLVSEGAKVLEEGVALRASDLELVYINDYGWASRCSQPMNSAQRAFWTK